MRDVEEVALIAFQRAVEPTGNLIDAEFFARIVWDSSAPAAIRRAAEARDAERVAQLLVRPASDRHSKRQMPRPTGDVRQSLWSLPDTVESARAFLLIEAWDLESRPNGHARSLERSRRNGRANPVRVARNRSPRHARTDLAGAAESWLRACAAGPALSPLEILVLFEILRDAGGQFVPGLAATLYRMALSAAIQTVGPLLDGDRFAPDAIGSSENGRWLITELAWQAGLLFAPVAGASRLAASAQESLRRMLLDSTDAAGVPSAETVGQLPAWFISLLRAREWGRRFARPLFDVAEEKRFRSVMSALSRMCRADGRLAFSNGRTKGLGELWSVAAASVPERIRDSSRAIKHLIAVSQQGRRPIDATTSKKRNTQQSNGHVRPKERYPVFQSDQSRLACLRTDWTSQANSLVVRHERRLPTLELATRGNVVLSGEWSIDLRLGGGELTFAAPWTCACWYSDDEADYLELQARPAAEVKIERQFLLSRKDDLLVLADAVIGPGGARLDYASRLPLVSGAVAQDDGQTRECFIASGKTTARVVPLGLPCNRTIGSAARLASSENCLELTQSGTGGLYAPLVIDWNPARRRRSALWRPLTVAQNGAALSASAAAAYRLQIGGSQWLVYRSLSHIREPRTVLGQHTMYETLIGRFLPTGAVEPIVQVEQRAEQNS